MKPNLSHRERPNDEYTLDDLRTNFPEGEYRVAETDFEGVARTGAATFTHAIPAEPSIRSPRLAEDEEAAAEVVVHPHDLVVRWGSVVETVTGDPVTITGYEVILTKVDHNDPNGWSRPVYDVHVGPDATRLAVPSEFVEPGTRYELEVLALEESGNQTIGLGFFTTRDTRPSRSDGTFEGVDVFNEHNTGADDLGFHVDFGAEPWSAVTITSPKGETVLDLSAEGSLREQGLASAFLESGEYSLADVPRTDFFARFPEGDYTFRGRSLDGSTLLGTAEFSHLIPNSPIVTSPSPSASSSPGPVTVAWEPVTAPDGVEIEVYQLQVCPVDPPEGQEPIAPNIDYTLEVPATVHSIAVPSEVLEPCADYEFELSAIDASGNRAFTVGRFAAPGA